MVIAKATARLAGGLGIELLVQANMVIQPQYDKDIRKLKGRSFRKDGRSGYVLNLQRNISGSNVHG